MWSGFSYDKKAKLAFVVTGDSGRLRADTKKSTGYANSVLAINAVDGRLLWQFQEIESDLWDLDMVGPPILVTLDIKGKKVDCVVAVSKSGNTLILDRMTGKLYATYSRVAVNGKRHLEITSPNPFSSTSFTLNDVTNLSSQKKDYVMHKIREADLTQYKETSFNKPIVLFGLHGEAEWPGAAVDPVGGIMVVPSNKYPWIIRTQMINASSINPEKIFNSNDVYKKKCLSCHQSNLAGFPRQNELEGDGWIPTLIGTTLKINEADFLSLENFKFTHKYAYHQLSSYLKRKNIGQSFFSLGKIHDMLRKIEVDHSNSLLNRTISMLNNSLATYILNKNEIDSVSTQDLSSLYLELKKMDDMNAHP